MIHQDGAVDGGGHFRHDRLCQDEGDAAAQPSGCAEEAIAPRQRRAARPKQRPGYDKDAGFQPCENNRQSPHDSGARPAQNSGLRMVKMQGFSHATRTGSRATTAERAPPRTTACALASGTLGNEGFCQQLECQSSADCEESETVIHSAAARGRELRLLSVVLQNSDWRMP